MHESRPPLREVLVIDDDEDNNFLTQIAFDDCGFPCALQFQLTATAALEYLEGLERFPDLILLDINMPVLDGWDFLEHYRRREYHERHATLIIMVSSSVYQEDKDKARTFQNVVEYVEKPLRARDIQRIRASYFAA